MQLIFPTPQRRRPVVKPGRRLRIDLNPNWIGIAAAENIQDPRSVEKTSMLEHAQVKLDMAVDASLKTVRETLAAVCDRATSMARKRRCGTIVPEKGLGKLKSSGRSRSLNRVMNYWARTVFVAMLTRRARLAGIEVLEVWAGYSSTIGNLAFEAPDACASATEIARQGIARLAGIKASCRLLRKGAFPVYGRMGRCPPNSARGSYRRPHPDVPIGARDSDVHGTNVRLSYLRLGQPATEFSGGEAQRIKLATELQRAQKGGALYVLDEPTTGLHPSDVERLVVQLNALVDAGNTVVVVDHDMSVAAASDWVIDIGPGAGDEGGRIIAKGTPEQVAGVKESRTAPYLRRQFPSIG